MIDTGIRHSPHLASAQKYAPAQVYLFHMCEKLFVETATSAIDFYIDHQCRPAGPEYLHRGVILPAIGLDGIKYATAAIGITVTVKKSAGSTGILKPVRFNHRAYHRLTGSGLGM